MLKKEIYREIEINNNELTSLENDIMELQDKLDKTEKLCKVLKAETQNNIDIFSPRSTKTESKERLNSTLKNMETLRCELNEKNNKIKICRQKKKELDELIKRMTDDSTADSRKTESKTRKENIVTNKNSLSAAQDINNQEKNDSNSKRQRVIGQTRKISTQSDTPEQNIEYSNIKKEDIPETNIRYSDIEKERALAGNRIFNNIKRQIDSENIGYTELMEDKKEINMEIRSGEVIILESERKKEKEFLQQIYLKLERSLALLNGNKNMCKKEMQQAKKMIADYVKKISDETEV